MQSQIVNVPTNIADAPQVRWPTLDVSYLGLILSVPLQWSDTSPLRSFEGVAKL
jgi:hypothetical protein